MYRLRRHHGSFFFDTDFLIGATLLPAEKRLLTPMPRDQPSFSG